MQCKDNQKHRYSAQVSPLWLEVLERLRKFLRQVVVGDLISDGRGVIPKSDIETQSIARIGIAKRHIQYTTGSDPAVANAVVQIKIHRQQLNAY